MKTKAAFIQFKPVFGDIDRNITQMDQLFQKAKEADLVVLPELPETGYKFSSRDEALLLSSEVNSNKFLDFLLQTSRNNQQYIISGFCERENNQLFNSSVFIGPEGILGKYRKMHLFWDEKKIFEPGNLGLPVFETDLGKIAMLICWDWAFPEVWRILGLKGAQLVCHPSNLVLPYAQQAVPVHGLINRFYCITTNRYGMEKGLKFSGNSIISGPDGKVICQAAGQEDEVKICELDLSKSLEKNLTPENHVFNDRRIEEYKDLLL